MYIYTYIHIYRYIERDTERGCIYKYIHTHTHTYIYIYNTYCCTISKKNSTNLVRRAFKA